MCTQRPLMRTPPATTPIGASSRSCDQPLIYDMIASAVCLRGKHKSTSPLLNTRAHQGYHHHPHTNPLPPTTHCKKCPPTQVLSSAVQTFKDLRKDFPLVKGNEFYVNLDFLCFLSALLLEMCGCLELINQKAIC